MVTFKSTAERQLRFIDPGHIAPSDRNPRARQEFDQRALASLIASVKKHGILQPIIVTPRGRNRYRLVEGERRWRVARALDIEKVPAYVIEPVNGRDETVAMYHLHHQRTDWGAADDFRALRQLRAAAPNATTAELADELGMSPSTARNRIMVGESHPALLAALEDGTLRFTDALRAVETADALRRLRPKAVDDLGGADEVARLLAEKAKLRRGLAPELVELRRRLVSPREVSDALLKRYIRRPEWSKRELYAATTKRTGSASVTNAPRASVGRGAPASGGSNGDASPKPETELIERVRRWREHLERETQDPRRISDAESLRVELVALADTIESVQSRLVLAAHTPTTMP